MLRKIVKRRNCVIILTFLFQTKQTSAGIQKQQSPPLQRSPNFAPTTTHRPTSSRVAPITSNVSDITTPLMRQMPLKQRGGGSSVIPTTPTTSTPNTPTTTTTTITVTTNNNSQKILLATAALSLTSLTLISLLSLITTSSPSSYYTPTSLLRDNIATVVSFSLAHTFVKLCIIARTRWHVLESHDTRKIVHTFSAPLFVSVWPLFDNNGGSRYFASVVLLLFGVRLYLAGKGGGRDEGALAKTVSRSGDAREALGGPLIYVVMVITSVLIWWRDNLIGITVISILAAGDGMADLVGRRYGKNNKWPFHSDKSIAGTAAFIISSTLASSCLIFWLGYCGSLTLPMQPISIITRLVLISCVCSIVELLPLVNDNLSVPISAAILSKFLLN